MDLENDYPEDDELYYYYNEEEEEDERGWDDGSSYGTYCGFLPSFLTQHYTPPPRTYLTQEEADGNARKLLEEEEREKQKANKKRERRKRQKERRRQQKICPAAPEGGKETTDNSRAGSESEEPAQPQSSASASEDDLDLGSTFVRKALSKMANKLKPESRERSKEVSQERASESRERSKEVSQERAPESRERSKEVSQERAPDSQSGVIQGKITDRHKMQQSLDLASMGNNLASRERFAESLYFYTEAIKMNPAEYRILGNRSYSYERLAQYEEALADANRALQLKPDFLKGFYRRGKALKGLQRYSEAIAAFRKVLACDMNRAEAAQEITQCQQRLQELISITRVKLLSSGPLSLPTMLPPAPGHNRRVFAPPDTCNTLSAPSSGPRPPANPPPGAAHSKLFPIWVGNITNQVTEDVLRSIFQQFRSLHSVRMLHSRSGAFIYYTSKEAAEAASRDLQGLRVGSSNLILQLRNPEHSAGGWKK